MSCPHGNHEESCDICAKIDEAYESGLRDGIKQERERCARIAEDHKHADDDFVCGGYNCGDIIATAIRTSKEEQ